MSVEPKRHLFILFAVLSQGKGPHFTSVTPRNSTWTGKPEVNGALILPPRLSISVPINRYFKERSRNECLRSHLEIELETSHTEFEGRALITNFSPFPFRLSHLFLYKNLVTVDNPIIRWQQPKIWQKSRTFVPGKRVERSYEKKVDLFARAKSAAGACSDCLVLIVSAGRAKVFVWRIKFPWLEGWAYHRKRVTYLTVRVTPLAKPAFCFCRKRFVMFCKEIYEKVDLSLG